MAKAWIEGKPAALDRAIGEAARLLAASRAPLIAGLGTDIAGARAAIGLADRIGAVIDHMHSGVLLRDLAVVREAGMMMTTPSEARLRADTLLLVGPGLDAAWPDLAEWLREDAAKSSHSAIRLCPGRTAKPAGNDAVTTIGRDPDQLPVLLAALRARIAGRPIGKTVLPVKTIDELASRLQASTFGVAVWSAEHLDALVIEMLCGIVADLNARIRFSGFSLAPGDNAVGVLQACGWMTGFPMRTGFGRGYPEHDPWRFDGARLVASREADCVLWISAYGAEAPAADAGLPMIALTAGEAARGFAVQIEVGQPGVDHDAVAHHATFGTLVAVPASQRSDAISVADAIGRIVAALPGGAPPQ
jgi:formylmethanofuran dehydrogenase subunit B